MPGMQWSQHLWHIRSSQLLHIYTAMQSLQYVTELMLGSLSLQCAAHGVGRYCAPVPTTQVMHSPITLGSLRLQARYPEDQDEIVDPRVLIRECNFDSRIFRPPILAVISLLTIAAHLSTLVILSITCIQGNEVHFHLSSGHNDFLEPDPRLAYTSMFTYVTNICPSPLEYAKGRSNSQAAE